MHYQGFAIGITSESQRNAYPMGSQVWIEWCRVTRASEKEALADAETLFAESFITSVGSHFRAADFGITQVPRGMKYPLLSHRESLLRQLEKLDRMAVAEGRKSVFKKRRS